MIPPKGRLFFQAELLDKRVIPALVIHLEVPQMIAAISDHLEKSPTRMEILRVFLQMFRQFVNLL